MKCNRFTPVFAIDEPATCFYCGEEFECHAPDASDDGRKSSAIGAPLLLGHYEAAVLTQLQKLSEKQSQQLYELTQGMEFLAQQVKTLVDAIAEEQDPDMPMTNYLSGKPV